MLPVCMLPYVRTYTYACECMCVLCVCFCQPIVLLLMFSFLFLFFFLLFLVIDCCRKKQYFLHGIGNYPYINYCRSILIAFFISLSPHSYCLCRALSLTLFIFVCLLMLMMMNWMNFQWQNELMLESLQCKWFNNGFSLRKN